jgi:hypothetical protein
VTNSPSIGRVSDEGAALIIVLAFVVLLTGLVAAYFARTTTDRQLAKAACDVAVADLLARSALDIVVADFKQEISNGGAITASNVVPQRSPPPGIPPSIPNLIRRSIRSDAVLPPAVPSQASSVNSRADPSMNGRSISFARWNSHYMIPKSNTGDDSSDPILGAPAFGAPNYWAPDWVLVTRSGPSVQIGIGSGSTALSNPISGNPNYVVGRYAYAVYDEGGLLDANLVGLPSPTPGLADIGRKGTIAFADLTAVRMTPAGSTPSPTTTSKMVAWRNYATLRSSGAFANLSPTPNPSPSFTGYFLDRTRDFRSAATTVYSGRTDQAFVNRRELIELFRGNGAAGSMGIGASFNLLQFLGTFSREINRSTWGNSGTVLASRFPLSRFDLFSITPPSAASALLIQRYFGLLYIPASGPTSPEHWQYNGTTGSTRQATIPPLAGTNQDPDLFRLLRYALPVATDSELLSIGASLIDQIDSDVNTTWIEFGDPAAPAQKAFGVDSIAPLNPVDPRPASPPVMLKRSFRNVGELGYAYRNGSTSLDFTTGVGPEAPLLDLFTYNTSSIRAGIINLNTQSSPVLAAIIKGALPTENSSTGITSAQATPAATGIAAATALQPAVGRQDVARLAGVPTNSPFNTGGTTGQENRETIARALAEVGQTRTWGLFIDLIAQAGRYPRTSTNLAQFLVEGEKRYWLHVAIDRFTGQIIDEQLEAVYE